MFQQEQRLSDEGVAALLTERLGREVAPGTVKNAKARGDRRLSKAWVEALELPDLPGPEFREHEADAPEPAADAPRDPKQPKPIPAVDEIDWRNAREAIIAIYVSIGKGVSMVTKKQHIAVVFAQGAPVLADDWIRLARVDARTRAVLAKLMVVGPGGQLAMDHMILIGRIISLEGGANGGITIPSAESLINAGDNGHGAESAMADSGTASPA